MKVPFFFFFFTIIQTDACCCFSKSTEGKNNAGPVFVSKNTCRPQTQRAAGSTIKHSWERWKDCEGQWRPRDTEGEAETESVSSQRLMGLICINLGCCCFFVCVWGGSRWAAIEFLSPMMLLFCPVCSSCSVQYNWEIRASFTALYSSWKNVFHANPLPESSDAV